MKQIVLTSMLALSTLFGASAQESKASETPVAPAIKGTVYGDKAARAKEMSAAQFKQEVTGEKPVTMQVIGKVASVCEKKGCWINVDLETGEQVFVKMKDYGFFVPKDMQGKTVLLTGEAYKKMMSVKELKHFAEDAQKTQAEIDAITEPQLKARFTASSIKVLD